MSASANDDCDQLIATGLLKHFCKLERFNGQLISPEFAKKLDAEIKNEGFSDGLKIGYPYKAKNLNIWSRVDPTLFYSENINGGISSKPLVLGSLILESDTTKKIEGGVVLGLKGSVGGKYLYGEGKYLNSNFDLAYNYNPTHRIGFSQISASICSINLIKNWWYIDACGDINEIKKKFTTRASSGVSLLSSSYISSAPSRHHKLTGGLKLHVEDAYSQSQILTGFETIHANSMSTNLNIILGEHLPGKHSLQRQFSVQANIPLGPKAVSVSGDFLKESGGSLLGYPRSDKTFIIGLSVRILNNLDLGFGYRITDSTINYYDVTEPIFSLNWGYHYW